MYLTLSAEYGRVVLQAEGSGSINERDLGLPDDLVADLAAWNERYQAVVVAGVDQRSAEPLASLISDLDQTGVELAGRIADAIPEQVKVNYYSEGLLKRLL